MLKANVTEYSQTSMRATARMLSPPYKRPSIKNTKIFTVKSPNLDDD